MSCSRTQHSDAGEARTLIKLLSREQSNLDPYCLQYRLPKNISRPEEQMPKDVTGRLRAHVNCNENIEFLCHTLLEARVKECNIYSCTCSPSLKDGYTLDEIVTILK